MPPTAAGVVYYALTVWYRCRAVHKEVRWRSQLHSQTHIARKWYRLDNAANVYPAIRSLQRPGLFRVSAILKEPVQPKLLQQALNATLKRIPSFSVKMRSGLFWHYFSHSDDTIHIQEDVVNPCMSLSSKRDSGFQIDLTIRNQPARARVNSEW